MELFKGVAYLLIIAAKGISRGRWLYNSYRLFIAMILKGGIALSVFKGANNYYTVLICKELFFSAVYILKTLG